MKEIEISEIRRLTQTIKDKYDYDFTNYALSSFKRRITRVLELQKIPDVDTLIKKVDEEDYFHQFVSEITVNVTEMFRDPSFWRELRENIIPSIIAANGKLRVWHAGCSSGEEVYSMAILLKEMNLLDKASIIASDIDTDILDRARKGIYTLKSMDLNAKNYSRFMGKYELEKYYTVDKERVLMDNTLVENVSFRKHNLVSGGAFSKFDLVLCRNVMIYFNQNLQNEVLKTIHESMFKNSYLAIGSKESLIWCDIINKYTLINGEEKIYKKTKD